MILPTIVSLSMVRGPGIEYSYYRKGLKGRDPGQMSAALGSTGNHELRDWSFSGCSAGLGAPFTTTLAGLPIATAYGGMSLTTTLLTPMTAPSPTVTPFKINE